MKKLLIVAIVFALCISLAACAGGKEDDGSSSAGSNNTVSTQTPTATPEPEATPAPAAPSVRTVSVSYEDYGGFSVSYPTDGSVTAEQFEESQEFVPDMDIQLARLAGEGFNIVLGYYRYSSGYEAWKEYVFTSLSGGNPTDVNFGGLDGFSYVTYSKSTFLILFPDEDYGNWMRAVSVYSDDASFEDLSDSDKVDAFYELFQLQEVQDILETLDFTGAGATGQTSDPEKTGTFDAGYIRFTADNGWYVNAVLEGSARISGDTFYVMQEGKNGVINISGMMNDVPSERVESLLGSSTVNATRLDNVTINGVEYMVLEMDNNGYLDYQYFTSIGGFDENKSGTIAILIQGFTQDEARSLLGTITIGGSF